jgi:hypothetical protein
MTEPVLSLWQRFRHYRLARAYNYTEKHQPGCSGIVTKDGQLLGVTDVVGYKWKLRNGCEVTCAEITDVGEAKWLYRIYY